jgi:N-acyl-D-amino-acid deacylase
MEDIMIKNGLIVDGTGNPWFRSDLLIESGRIAGIGSFDRAGSGLTIDATGLVVAPGFIDMHSHSDLFLLINPFAESKIRQGVTTEVIGNCGSTLAPILEERLDLLKRNYMPLSEEVDWSWRSFGDYLRVLEERKTSVNTAPLVGHGTIRIAVLGYENRAPVENELEEMKSLVEEAMKSGARGLSSGLIYTPASFSKTEELIELCKVVSRYGGFYSSHIRNESSRLLEAVAEAIEIGEKAGVPVEISHHKAAGGENWGKVNDSLQMIEDARKRGVDVTCDVYPYTAGSTDLSACVPTWAHENGLASLLNRLRDTKIRSRLKLEISEGIPGWENLAKQAGWENIIVSQFDPDRSVEGKSLAVIAGLRNQDPIDAAFDLLIESQGVAQIVIFEMSERDIETVLRHSCSMVGTDGSSYAPYGKLHVGKPHPRNYGTYPRILGRYTREKRLLRLEDAIRKMTSLPAQRLGTLDRGLIAEGMRADITIFDPNTVLDLASYQDPHRYPHGIRYVIVNGEITVRDGEHTGARAGMVLRK